MLLGPIPPRLPHHYTLCHCPCATQGPQVMNSAQPYRPRCLTLACPRDVQEIEAGREKGSLETAVAAVRGWVSTAWTRSFRLTPQEPYASCKPSAGQPCMPKARGGGAWEQLFFLVLPGDQQKPWSLVLQRTSTTETPFPLNPVHKRVPNIQLHLSHAPITAHGHPHSITMSLS